LKLTLQSCGVDSYHLNEIFFTVVNEYTDWERTVQHPINTRDATIAALSDAQYVAPVVHTGDLLSRTGAPHGGPKCFFYVFDYQTKDGDYPQVNFLYSNLSVKNIPVPMLFV